LLAQSQKGSESELRWDLSSHSSSQV